MWTIEHHALRRHTVLLLTDYCIPLEFRARVPRSICIQSLPQLPSYLSVLSFHLPPQLPGQSLHVVVHTNYFIQHSLYLSTLISQRTNSVFAIWSRHSFNMFNCFLLCLSMTLIGTSTKYTSLSFNIFNSFLLCVLVCHYLEDFYLLYTSLLIDMKCVLLIPLKRLARKEGWKW